MTDHEPELILWTWTGDDPPPADMRPDPTVTQYVPPDSCYVSLSIRARLLEESPLDSSCRCLPFISKLEAGPGIALTDYGPPAGVQPDAAVTQHARRDRIHELLEEMKAAKSGREAHRLAKELRTAICADERETQPITLNQRAHLLSAEFGVTPREALEWLQGGQS